MTDYQEITSFFEERGPEDIERFIDKNLDISQQIYALLADRNWNQNDLAKALNKSTAEISKWLSGSHNLTLRSIAKMEAVLKADIILTPKKAVQKFQEVDYVTLKVYANKNKFPDQVNYEKSTIVNKSGEAQQTLKVA
ncbi:MAG: hypothetical protein DHS20C18_13910 [Saprospiraceae bacterium]|nr:MAG: hypothetical protein DHS20C18_13910 [Saprospiraceae bacterium]